MWVIVAVTLAFSGSPKFSVMPGPTFATKDECLRAQHLRSNFDSEGGTLDFSVCMPKDSVQIGAQAPNPSK